MLSPAWRRAPAVAALVIGTILVGAPSVTAANRAASCKKSCSSTTTTTVPPTSTTVPPTTTTAPTTIAPTTTSSTTTTTAPAPTTTSSTTTTTIARVPQGGVWVSPEGVTIDVSSAGGWTVSQVYGLLKASARDLDKLGPTLTVKVQDTYASATSASASQTDGQYVGFRATIYLKGVNSNFAYNPDAIMAHEYGHAWSYYHLYMTQQGAWGSYLQARGIAGDTRLDSSYNWDRGEIIADDYRLLFGSSAAVAQMPNHLNADIPHPRNVAGLGEFLSTRWSVARV